VVNEAVAIPGIFGLAHEWSQPVSEPTTAPAATVMTGVASRDDAREQAA
jgi:hypothetical protein